MRNLVAIYSKRVFCQPRSQDLARLKVLGTRLPFRLETKLEGYASRGSVQQSVNQGQDVVTA